MGGFEKIEALLLREHAHGFPFGTVIVTHHGEDVYEFSFGTAYAATGRPMGPDVPVWFYSMSKVPTCVAGVQLLEQGKLHLDDPVGDYLPAFRHVRVRHPDGTVTPAAREMTVEHLFTMASGLDYDLNRPALVRAMQNPDAGTVELVNAMAEDPLIFEPGARYEYSLSHDVLAAVVEVASGMPFEDYMQANVFGPVGAGGLTYHATAAQKAALADQYWYDMATCQGSPMTRENEFIFTERFASGGAGVYGNARDFSRLVAALSVGGRTTSGERILGDAGMHMMMENRLSNDQLNCYRDEPRKYGYGWGLCGEVHMDPYFSQSRSAVGQFGWAGAANSYCLIDPVNEVSITYVAHLRACAYGYNTTHVALKNLTYEALGLGER